MIHANSKGKLKGTKIKFSNVSVGATENSIIASCLAKGTTILKNCAVEPEIKDLTNFLISAGAKIKWIGKRTVQIEGIKSLNSVNYSVMSDRIETGTFCVAACLTRGDIIIKNFGNERFGASERTTLMPAMPLNTRTKMEFYARQR